MTPANFQQLANFIWFVADLLRGPYRLPQYERVMLPLTVLRRFDAVLAIEEVFGNESLYDWNQVWDKAQKIVKRLPDDQGWAKGAKGTAQKKAFREAFTEVDTEAVPVIAKEHKKVELDLEALFPGQDLSHAKARS